MKQDKAKKSIKILAMIQKDMEKDTKEFDGKPFDGKTVAEYFGNHGAAIAALARIVSAVVEEIITLKEGGK